MSRPNPATISPEAKVVLTFEVNAIAKIMEEKFPKTWKRMYTKSIDAPGNFYSSKSLAVGMTGSIEEIRWKFEQGKQLESNAGTLAGFLEVYDFPTYYVSGPLIEALRRTRPPDDFTWDQLELPYPALCFMLPRGSLKEPVEHGGADIILIGIARFPKGKRLYVPTVGYIEELPEDSISVFWTCGPSGIVVNDSNFPPSQQLKDLAQWVDERTPEDRGYVGPRGDFAVNIIALAANLILLMQARQEFIEPGRRLTKQRLGKVDQWSPTFLGRNYTVLRRGEPKVEAQGHFTQLGWRAGHFKRQHFGPKNEQVKTIFVEPYIAYTRSLKTDESIT